MNNTLLSRVYNKLFIVLFCSVVGTLSIVLREGSTIAVLFFIIYYFSLKVKKIIRRAFTGTSKSNNSIRIQWIEVEQSYQLLITVFNKVFY